MKVTINSELVYGMIEKYGAIGTCKRLTATGKEHIQSGFTKLWEKNRLDLTFEYLMLDKKYNKLFAGSEFEKNAQDRLNQFK